MARQRLTRDVWAVGIHGVTGKDHETGWLAGGTLVRAIKDYAGSDGPVQRFEASTDLGKSWYAQRAYEPEGLPTCS